MIVSFRFQGNIATIAAYIEFIYLMAIEITKKNCAQPNNLDLEADKYSKPSYKSKERNMNSNV